MLLWVASFCVSIYVSWIPGPAERRLVGCWTTTIEAGGLIGDVRVLMELRSNRFITVWFWNHEDSQWEHSGETGRWSFDGNEFEVRVANTGGRDLEDVLQTAFGGGRRERAVVVDADVDRLVMRVSDTGQTIEWTRVSDDLLPKPRK